MRKAVRGAVKEIQARHKEEERKRRNKRQRQLMKERYKK